MKRIISFILIVVMCIMFTPGNAYATVKISKAKATMEVDSTLKLTVSTASKITWTTNNKSIATVSSSGTITAKSEGKAVITATINTAKYICTVTVVNSNKSVPVASVKTASEFEVYLSKTYSSVKTDMGVIKFSHIVYKNDSDVLPFDFSIETDWDNIDLPYDIEHSISYSDSEKENTKKKLREVQEKIYNDFAYFFPEKKAAGGYSHSWYEYPNIHEGLISIDFLSWRNYTESDDYSNVYKKSIIDDFRWAPEYDDYDFTK